MFLCKEPGVTSPSTPLPELSQHLLTSLSLVWAAKAWSITTHSENQPFIPTFFFFWPLFTPSLPSGGCFPSSPTCGQEVLWLAREAAALGCRSQLTAGEEVKEQGQRSSLQLLPLVGTETGQYRETNENPTLH